MFLFVAAELLTYVVYQRYMQKEIQPRYKTPIFDPNLCLQSASLTPSFSFFYRQSLYGCCECDFLFKCALWIAISQNRPKYFHK